MKIAFFTALLLSVGFLFGQTETDGETQTETPAPTPKYLKKCRDLLMVPDCSGYVYSDFRQIEGRDVEIIFHSNELLKQNQQIIT